MIFSSWIMPSHNNEAQCSHWNSNSSLVTWCIMFSSAHWLHRSLVHNVLTQCTSMVNVPAQHLTLKCLCQQQSHQRKWPNLCCLWWGVNKSWWLWEDVLCCFINKIIDNCVGLVIEDLRLLMWRGKVFSTLWLQQVVTLVKLYFEEAEKWLNLTSVYLIIRKDVGYC